MKTIESHLSQFPLGSDERLVAIYNLNIGEASNAAKRVLEKRSERRRLMSIGHSQETACLIVNNQNKIQ
jgi:hypothetical protein